MENEKESPFFDITSSNEELFERLNFLVDAVWQLNDKLNELQQQVDAMKNG